MNLLSSLRNRIWLASSLLAVLCIGVAIYVVNVRVTREAERRLDREIVATAALVDNLRTTRTETFTQMARFIADAPKIKAAVDTNDPPTVQDLADGYQRQINSGLLIVTSKTGAVLATVGASRSESLIAAIQPAVREGLVGRESQSLLPLPDGMLQLVTVPLYIGLTRPDMLGTVSVGFMIDRALAEQLKQQTTGSDLAFGVNGQILASTLSKEDYPVLASRLGTTGISRVKLRTEEFIVLPLEFGGTASTAPGREPVALALILRSRTEQLRLLQPIQAGLMVTGVLAVLLATLLSFAVARTIARPLATITDVMREVAATGDLTRKITLRGRTRWEDEDARLLATTFNTLTDSISRFQREMSQKERLMSLGRLSTVVAHEVRNPLMIIKASLHALRQPEVSTGAIREAVADIDEEVARLNRIVNEFLDFARPIQFSYAQVDLNALCRESASAALASGPGAEITLDLDPELAPIKTDPDRLRIALVNILVNARHAVNGEAPAASAAANTEASGEPPVTLTSRAHGGRIRIVVADRGCGIDPGALAQVFDPYFTTKHGGTGLGLPIAKNIVEGLGGSISIKSAPEHGTNIAIVLPAHS
jgi:signal transduction histidine kinase